MRAYRMAVLLTAFTLFLSVTAVRAEAQGGRGEFGSIAVRTVPPDAQVYIDGEQWVGPQTDGRLVVQVPPGRHLIEVRAPGYRSYVSEIDVRAGETTPVNVSLGGTTPQEQPPAPQEQPPASPAGPVTPIHQVATGGEENGVAFSPDYRVADVNHHAAQLLGGYAGVVLSGHLFLGGGGYWQLDYSNNDINLSYGGFVAEWRQWNDRRLGVTFHTLVGGGDARVRNVTYIFGHANYPYADQANHPDADQNSYQPRAPFDGYYVDYREGFFVFEPEVQLNLRVTRDVRLTAGVGYRVTATDRRAVSGNQLDGVSGTVSVRFGK